MYSSTRQAYPELPFYDFWFPDADRRVQRRLNYSSSEVLGPELADIGRSLGANPDDERAAISRAKARVCYCKRHIGTFPRCLFEAPRHLGEVLANANSTGLKGAALLASVSATLPHRDDDVWVALGIGSGVDVLGIEDGRGTRIAHLVGVDLSEVALRVAHALHPQLKSGQSIHEVDIPVHGELFVVSSLVFNYASAEVARDWAETVARARSSCTWVNVGYYPDHRKEQGTRWVAEQRLRALGFRDERRPIQDQHRAEVSSGRGEFVAEVVHWAR